MDIAAASALMPTLSGPSSPAASTSTSSSPSSPAVINLILEVTATLVSTGISTPARKRSATKLPISRKPRDNELYAQFTITSLPQGRWAVYCNNCSEYNKFLKTFNPTKAQSHLVNQCTGVTWTSSGVFYKDHNQVDAVLVYMPCPLVW